MKTGKVLWTFQTGCQIARRASVYSVERHRVRRDRRRRHPDVVGGGTAAPQVQVFSLGGYQTQSPAPQLPAFDSVRTAPAQQPQAAPATAPEPVVHAAPRHRAAPVGFGTIATPGGLVVQPWLANSSNVKPVLGRILLNGAPVAGARVVVDGYAVPRATAANGTFPYDVDITLAERHVVHVSGLAHATVHGHALSAGQQSALTAASGGFSVGYGFHGLTEHLQKDGSVVVMGRVTDTAGDGPPAVHLLTYQLSGTITDASGKPVQGAVVITRTQDRDFWTHSSATDVNGHYSSFFAASTRRPPTRCC